MPDDVQIEAPLQLALAENIITLLCHSDEHGKVIAALLQPHHFENEVHRTLAMRAQTFWRKHKKAPGKHHTPDLVTDIISDPENRRGPTYRGVLNNMLALSDSGVNADYVLGELRNYLRMIAFKKALLESADKFQEKQHLAIGEVEEMWSTLLRSRQIEFEPGLKLQDYKQVVDYLEKRASEFDTGIRTFDKAGIVPARGASFLFLAPPGRGKSWFAIACGKAAFRDRKRVLHLTLEMSEQQVLARYYQSLFGVPRYDVDIRTTKLNIERIGKREKFVGIQKKSARPKFALNSGDVLAELEAHLGYFGARVGNLLIKGFPGRQLTMDQLRGYLDNLELVEKFTPDLIILDYFGLVKTDARNHRIDLGRAYEDWRGLLQERNVAGLTPHQVSKKGADARHVSATHIAEDYSLVATSDIAVTYSATSAERDHGLARLFVAKAREFEDQFGVLITQNYALGQFCIDDMRLDREYWRYLDTEFGGEDAEEEQDDE